MNGHQQIAQNSKTWLLNAFFDLLADVELQEMTVTAITDKAGLSRRTFYRLFQDKYDLVDYYADQKLEQYVTLLQEKTGQTLSMEDILSFFLNFWWDERDHVKILVQRGIFHHVAQKIDREAAVFYQMFRAPWHIVNDSQAIDVALAFTLGGLWRVLAMWLCDPAPVAPEKIAQTIMSSLKQSRETGRFEIKSATEIKN